AHCACEPASTAPGVSWGSGKGGVGRVVGWARCWVLRKRARAWVPLDCGTTVPASGEVVGCGGPGCFLRTAQWTRASLANDEISGGFPLLGACLGFCCLSAICFDRFVCSSF